jgi:hypothetical protein
MQNFYPLKHPKWHGMTQMSYGWVAEHSSIVSFDEQMQNFHPLKHPK